MKSLREQRTLLVASAVTLCLLIAGAHAAVEDHIPQDAIAVLKLNDLASHYERFVGGPVAARLKDPAFVPELAARIREAETAIQEFERQHEVDVKEVLLDILGRQVAIAALPDETAVLVAEADDARSLRRAVDEFLRVERLTGKLLDSSTAEYKGVTIHSSILRDRRRHHALSGRALAVSEHFAAIERVIDVGAGDTRALSESSEYEAASALAPTDAVAVAYVGASSLKALAETVRAQAAQEQRRPPRRRTWKRMMQGRLAETLPFARFAVLWVETDEDLKAHLAVAYKGGSLPAGLGAALPTSGAVMEILDIMPPQTVFAAARGMDPEGTWDGLMETLLKTDPRRARWLKEGLDRLIAMIGGVYDRGQFFDQLAGQAALFLLPGAGAGDLPALAAAVRLREVDRIPIALESIVGAAATFARAEGKPEVSLESAEYEGVRLTTVRLDKPGPLGRLSPTFGVVDDNIVVTTSLEAARQIADAARTKAHRPRVPAEGTPYSVGVLNVAGLADLVAEHREFLVRHVMLTEGKPETRVRKDLDALEKLLSLAERVEYRATFGPGRTDHHVTVRFSQGLE